MASKVEVEVASPADKFWAAIRDSTELFPKIFPLQYKSIEIVEGDGKSVGSTRIIKYAEGNPLLKFAKEKVEVVDDEKKLVTYSVIEGELLFCYKIFRPTIEVASKEDGGALVKWSVEYEKANDEAPGVEGILEMVVKTLRELDEYLLKN